MNTLKRIGSKRALRDAELSSSQMVDTTKLQKIAFATPRGTILGLFDRACSVWRSVRIPPPRPPVLPITRRSPLRGVTFVSVP